MKKRIVKNRLAIVLGLLVAGENERQDSNGWNPFAFLITFIADHSMHGSILVDTINSSVKKC